MGAIADYIAGKLPAFLQRPMGQAFGRTFAAIGDDIRDTATFAFREAMIETATADSYPAHLRNSRLPVVRNEAAAAQLAALRLRWFIARELGGVEGVVDALARLGYAGCTVTTQLDLFLGGNLTAFGAIQGFFLVTIPWPNPFTDPALWEAVGITWDQVGPPGPVAGVPLEWDLQEPYPGALDDIKYIIRWQKHGCSSCRYIQLFTDAMTSVNIPVAELWEYGPDGSHPDLYTSGY